MHDGAISQGTITLTESQALRVKMEFERDILNMRQWIGEPEESISSDIINAKNSTSIAKDEQS